MDGHADQRDHPGRGHLRDRLRHHQERAERGLLFINQGDIPLPASGSARPGDPYIVNNSDNPIQPSAARVGDTITIYGMNFGLEKGTSEVYFTWAGLQTPASGSLDLANLLPARDYNLDYISWSDREIKLRVPDGAASGNVLVTSDKGRSNAAYFVVNKGPAPRTTPLRGSTPSSTPWTSRSAAASGDNTLYLWMPRILPTPEQRKIEMVAQDPDAPAGHHGSSALYSLTNLQKGGKYQGQLELDVRPLRGGDTGEPRRCASVHDRRRSCTPSSPRRTPWCHRRVRRSSRPPPRPSAGRRIRGSRPDGSTTGFSPSSSIPRPRPDVLAALRSKKGRRVRVLLPVLRAAAGGGDPRADGVGIPRRGSGAADPPPLLGRVLRGDPRMGARGPAAGGREEPSIPTPQPADFDARAYYFGNLDNQHVTFTKGLEEVNQMNPDGKTRADRDLPYLLTIHEEAVGGLTAYATSFEDLAVTGRTNHACGTDGPASAASASPLERYSALRGTAPTAGQRPSAGRARSSPSCGSTRTASGSLPRHSWRSCCRRGPSSCSRRACG